MQLPALRRLVLVAAMVTLKSAAFAAAVPDAEPGGQTLLLWPDGAPGAERVHVHEALIERLPDGPMRDRYAEHVTKPLLTLFAPKGTYNGITLLIVPGGGYVRVVIDKEGFEAAEWFSQRGFAAAVLRYRQPADGWAAGADAPAHDVMRAMRLLRQQPLPAGAPPTRVGVIGFSAGGHMVARLITEPTLAYPHQDTAEQLSARPDFAVLMYPVIVMGLPGAHGGSSTQLRAAGVSEQALKRYSADRNVRADTPPTLLIHAADDATVPVENSLLMYEALRTAKVPAELHVFATGGHGFGLRSIAGKDVEAWPTLVENWALRDGRTK